MTDGPPARPAYRIATARLLLRCWSPHDAPLLRASLDASDAHLRPWIPFMRSEPRSPEETVRLLRERRAAFDRDEAYRYAVLPPAEDRVIGEAASFLRRGPGSREIGYWLDVGQGGRGYATEATAALVRVAFEVDRARRVEIHCAPENTASAAVAERLGFRHEGTLAERFEDSEGDWRDTMVWTLFRAGYGASPARRAEIAAYDAVGDRLL